ncbi:glycosyltransferase family 25 protein [Cucumibacter marinus]|uniref:glycosyltransferase family 25 protein n=1 Tax=Cucumibacter marinus TaxID=1121252 RepID=UPI00041B4555|nr:glycosyltransferase family 25 protein [Cucumibacter marinus]
MRRHPRLEGLPPIRYINLERSADRREQMERQFEAYGLSEAARVTAIDGAAGEAAAYLETAPILPKRDGYLACMLSHLRAIERWLEDGGGDEVIIAEDDLKLDSVDHWPFDWTYFRSQIPLNYDVVQLALMHPYKLHFVMHPRLPNNESAAAYLINRPYAEKLMRLYRGEKGFCLDRLRPEKSSAEALVFSSGLCFSFPLFSFDAGAPSSLYTNTGDGMHVRSDALHQTFWTQKAPRVTDWAPVLNPWLSQRWNVLDWRLHVGMVRRRRFPLLPRRVFGYDPLA